MEEMEWLKLEAEVSQATRDMGLCHPTWASHCSGNPGDLGSESPI